MPDKYHSVIFILHARVYFYFSGIFRDLRKGSIDIYFSAEIKRVDADIFIETLESDLSCSMTDLAFDIVIFVKPQKALGKDFYAKKRRRRTK